MQAKACSIIAKEARKMGFNIWSYSGWTFEKLMEKSKDEPEILDFLNEIDVLIDGPFILNQKSLNLYYRGSKNQRVIDVKRSLEENKAIIIQKYMEEKPIRSFKYNNAFRASGIFV